MQWWLLWVWEKSTMWTLTSTISFILLFAHTLTHRSIRGTLTLIVLPQSTYGRRSRWTPWSIWKHLSWWRRGWSARSASARPTSWWSPALMVSPGDGVRRDGEKRQIIDSQRDTDLLADIYVSFRLLCRTCWLSMKLSRHSRHRGEITSCIHLLCFEVAHCLRSPGGNSSAAF